MQGTLTPGVLPGLLRDVYVGRKSGLVHFTRGDERRGVRFRRGHIANASSSAAEDRLGEVLVRLRVLSQADLERATAVMLKDKKRLGIVLQELGVMSREKLEESLVLHVREILLKVFSWSDGAYAFEEQDADAHGEDDVGQRLSTGEMILEAVRRVQDPEAVRHALGDQDRVLALSNDPLLRFQKITLSPSDGFLLSRVDGTLSAHEVLELAPGSSEDAERSLFGLLCTGVVEFAPGPPKRRAKRWKTGRLQRPDVAPALAPPPAAPAKPGEPASAAAAPPPAGKPAEDEAAKTRARRSEIDEMYDSLKTRTHFEVLSIPRASTEAQVKEAYVRLAKRFHPDTEHDPGLSDLANKIEAIFIRIADAYDILRNPRTRASYEERLGPTRLAPGPASGPSGNKPAAADAAQPSAEAPAATAAGPSRGPQEIAQALKLAERLLQQEKYWDVIQALEPQLQDATGKLKIRAQLLLAKAYVKNPKWVKRAEEELQRVVQADPGNFEACLLLGGIYQASGLRARATSMFKKAAELQPDDEAAAAALAELGAVPEATEAPKPGGSLLKRLFKKE
jgi:curved DNA-binding protein CbpA